MSEEGVVFEAIIKNGLCFDGTGAPGAHRHLGLQGGRVVEVSESPLSETDCPKVVDAKGCLVTPGFLDIHTHYDAELLAAPSLSESVRHGVTTVTVGSCSISTILSEAEDCSDLFTRVESVPRREVLPLLESQKQWSSPTEYVRFLQDHPLGANVTAFLGHSDLRTRVMGLARAVDRNARPSEDELQQMERWLHEALDCGLLGLSTMTNPWDKLDGDRHRSASLPSTYARWSEYRRLHKVLRKRGRILQSAPNITTKVNALLFLLESVGLGRSPLKTTLITLADAKSSRGLHRPLGFLSRVLNRLNANFRWQTLPVPFEVYADGIDLVVFEEFGAGQQALHLVDQLERNELMSSPSYRENFKRDYEKKWSPRVWQRDFGDAFIVDCPDSQVRNRSFADVAKERGQHPVDTFLDLVITHGTQLRWRTTIANDRPEEIARMINEPSALIGFADSGAHIRNMAFYSFPLRMLKLVQERNIMPMERAIRRLTGEIADWFSIDAGYLRKGDRADLVVLDPAALDARLDAYHEAPMEGFKDLRRMVNRSDGVVRQVFIRGQLAFDQGTFAEGLGKRCEFGQFLPADKKVDTTIKRQEQAA